MIEYYKRLLVSKNHIDNSQFIVFNILIGNNYSRLFDYYNALLHYAIAFSLLDHKNWLTGELYHHIGDVWTSMNNFRNALLCYEEALTILNSYHVKDRYIARIYRRMSYIYIKQNNNNEAIIYEEQANQIDTSFRRRSDLDYEISLEYYRNQLNNNVNLTPQQRADMLFSISLYFLRKFDYSQALENLLQAKQLFTDNLPSYDGFAHKFASIYEIIAFIKFILNENFEALIMWK
jgi:tetratricopeptide (TPR) repeat protein